MELERFENVGNIAAELDEIRKFESNDGVEAWISISELCTPVLTIICC